MPSPQHRQAFRAAGLAAACLATGWACGFAWFVHRATERPDLPPHADGIVALTGGADRIPAALALLSAGAADTLLISGAGPDVTAADLGISDPALARRVTLGHEAVTTAGNAAETAAWAVSQGLHSLIVVTASYHMPRALAELGHALPEVALYPVPVYPRGVRAGGWRALWLMAREYDKFVAAKFGFGRMAGGLRE